MEEHRNGSTEHTEPQSGSTEHTEHSSTEQGLYYKNGGHFSSMQEGWHLDTFTGISGPMIYVADRSFGWAAHGLEGTEPRFDIEVSDYVYRGARIIYTVIEAPSKQPFPAPPRELEYETEWVNGTDGDDYVPSLPSSVDLWCYLELCGFSARMIGEKVVVCAEYTYQYSTEPVFDYNN